MKIRHLIVLAAAPVFLVTSCSGDGDDATQEAKDLMNEADITDETGSDDVVVIARDNVFVDEYIEVKAGTTVTFENTGETVHNVLPVEEGAFTPIEADEFDPDDVGTVTFDEVGDVPYYCSLHGTKTKGMIGGVRVVE
ncbi:MAG: cupredoxin domain-containing protein [Microthrixaceae bacterium]